LIVKNKIVHIIPTLGGGGAEVLLGHISIEQVKRGYEVHIILLEDLHFTYKNYPFKNELEEKVSIHHIREKIHFSLKKQQFYSSTKRIEHLLKHIKPTVIHSHLYLSEIHSHLFLLKNVKYITHLHDNMHQFTFLKNNKLKTKFTDYLETRWLKKSYLKANTNFIAISKNTSDYFRQKLPNKLKNNIFLLPNAINTKKYTSNFSDKPKPYKLVSVGNLVPKKNHEMLINVMNYLVINSNIHFHLDILGFGPLQEELQLKIDNLGLGNYITLHGNVSNVDDFLTNSDIYVHTAKYEPFGMVFIEAMSSGLPIVSTNGKGNIDLIKNNFNGFLMKSFDIKEFSESIDKIAKNKTLRKELSKNSLEFSKKFCIENYVDKLDKIYFGS
jgi:glycosyltransferase EpsD